MAYSNNAPSDNNKVERRHIYRDTRTFWTILKEDLKSWDLAICFVLLLPILAFYSPVISFIVGPLIVFLTYYSGLSKQNKILPMKLPVFMKGFKDYNDVYPGNRKKCYNAGATILLGNIQKGRKEVWIKGKDLLTHMMVIGTTGGGKTEMLVSLAGASSFCMGGGLVYVDAKAAPKLLYQFVTLSRLFGREDDFRVINYQTGNKIVAERHFDRLSNTTNPFAQGTANTAVQTLTGLLPSGGGDNQYFLDRAIAILRTLMPALVELRDQGIINIYPSLIGECISIEKFVALGKNEIEFNGIKYPHIKLSDRAVKVINTFLKQLPNFKPGLPANQQPEEASKQFGFAEGYFARTLANLAGTYGHIYETELAESDFVDIVMHNRILVVMVPAAESSSEERAALGKVVLSSIRVAMAQGLGNKGEGDRADALDSLPIDLRIPTIVIVDEYAEVAVDGFAVTATQGRGLGMGVIFAGQDLAGFERANEQEANMIFGNTNIKVLLKLQDPKTTWERFRALADTIKVATGGGWEQDQGGGLNTYKTQLSASIQDADRININDLKGQIEGEAHLFESDNIHRVQMFHHGVDDDDLVENFRINRLLKIKVPSPDQLETLKRNNMRIKQIEHTQYEDAIIDEPALITDFHKFKELHKKNWISMYITSQEDVNSLSVTSSTKDTMDDIVEKIDTEQQFTEGESYTDHGMGDIAFASSTLDLPDDSDSEDTELDEKQGVMSEDSKTRKISKELTKTLSKNKNQWIFSSAAAHYSEDLDDGCEHAMDRMAEVNIEFGLSEDAAKEVSTKVLEDVSASVNYPSIEIESLTSDPDDLWELTHKNTNSTE